MLLSYFTATTNITRQTRVVGDAYQSLGLLSRIAKNVRDYKITRFGGATKSRTAVRYDEKTPAVVKTTAFVRQWIKDTEERGLLRYKRSSIIAKKSDALHGAYRLVQAKPIDLDWDDFGELQLSKHLKALETKSNSSTKDFDFKFLRRFRGRFAFNEATLERFPDELTSESSTDELPLSSQQWQSSMAVSIEEDTSEEAKERERKRRASALAARDEKEAVRNAPRKRGRPRKKPPPPPPAPKKKRGRPPGTRNKLKRGGAREVTSQDGKAQLRQSTFVAAAVFDADDDGDGYLFSTFSHFF